MIPESVVHVRSSSGLRERQLGSAFFMRDKGKVKVSDGCYFNVGNNVRATTSVNIDNCIVSNVVI